MGNPLEILQPIPWKPMSIAEVVNKVEAGQNSCPGESHMGGGKMFRSLLMLRAELTKFFLQNIHFMGITL